MQDAQMEVAGCRVSRNAKECATAAARECNSASACEGFSVLADGSTALSIGGWVAMMISPGTGGTLVDTPGWNTHLKPLTGCVSSTRPLQHLALAKMHVSALFGYSVSGVAPGAEYAISKCQAGLEAFTHGDGTARRVLSNCPFEDSWLIRADNRERDTPEDLAQLWVDMTVDSRVVVCFDSSARKWRAPSWLDSEQWTFIHGSSLMIECDARPCWERDVPAGRLLMMGNKGTGSAGGDTYITFVQRYMTDGNSFSPNPPIYPGLAVYEENIAAEQRDQLSEISEISFEMDSCDARRLSEHHAAIVAAAAMTIQAQECPVTHPWPFTVNSSHHHAFCCRAHVPSNQLDVFLNIKDSTSDKVDYLCADETTNPYDSSQISHKIDNLQSADCAAECTQHATCSFFSAHPDGECRIFTACHQQKIAVAKWTTFQRNTQSDFCDPQDSAACPNPPCQLTSPEVALKISVSATSGLGMQVGEALVAATRLSEKLKQTAVTPATGFPPERILVDVAELRAPSAAPLSNTTSGLGSKCKVELSAVLMGPSEALAKSFKSRELETACCPHSHGTVDQHANAIIAHAGFI